MDKNHDFQKFSSVNMNKKPKHVRIHDLWFTNLVHVLKSLSYDDFQQ